MGLPLAVNRARLDFAVVSFGLNGYPDAEHGMTEHELNANGERASTRHAPGYFRMVADFLSDSRIGGDYGGRGHCAAPRPLNAFQLTMAS